MENYSICHTEPFQGEESRTSSGKSFLYLTTEGGINLKYIACPDESTTRR
jgi:hypothetical protein